VHSTVKQVVDLYCSPVLNSVWPNGGVQLMMYLMGGSYLMACDSLHKRF